jgi:adenosylcobinamide kinase/adenosylcobinamide-phosphate guanylyltransferase
MGHLVFVTGGARSGKSRFAERLASAAGGAVVYIATLEPLDGEMRDRVARHRAQRPESWQTVEEPGDLVRAVVAIDGAAVALVDCLSLWVSNRLLTLGEEPAAEAVAELEAQLDGELTDLVETARGREATTIVVSNEVGGGVVPPSVLGRVYRDLLGRANQRMSLAADEAWLLVAGRALRLPPAEGETEGG